MVSRYNDIFSTSSTTSATSSTPTATTKFKAIEADLLSASATSNSIEAVSDDNFDLAVVGLGFHHFHNPVYALKVLKEKVKVGGVVGIVDFLPFPSAATGHGHDHSHKHSHAANHDERGQSHSDQEQKGKGNIVNAFPSEALPTIKTHGFSKEDMARLFAEAGLEDPGFAVMRGEVEMFVGADERRVVRTVFLATAVRGA